MGIQFFSNNIGLGGEKDGDARTCKIIKKCKVKGKNIKKMKLEEVFNKTARKDKKNEKIPVNHQDLKPKPVKKNQRKTSNTTSVKENTEGHQSYAFAKASRFASTLHISHDLPKNAKETKKWPKSIDSSESMTCESKGNAECNKFNDWFKSKSFGKSIDDMNIDFDKINFMKTAGNCSVIVQYHLSDISSSFRRFEAVSVSSYFLSN